MRWIAGILLFFSGILSAQDEPEAVDFDELKNHGARLDGSLVVLEGYLISTSHFPLSLYPTEKAEITAWNTPNGLLVVDRRLWSWSLDDGIHLRLTGKFKFGAQFPYGQMISVHKLEFLDPIEN